MESRVQAEASAAGGSSADISRGWTKSFTWGGYQFQAEQVPQIARIKGLRWFELQSVLMGAAHCAPLMDYEAVDWSLWRDFIPSPGPRVRPAIANGRM